MSGDVQPRKRKDKDKKKKKSQLEFDEFDGDGNSGRFLNIEDEDAGDLPPGGDSSHDVADDHGHHGHGSASWCGKIIFLTLLATLLMAVALVFFESWGKSFKEVSITESRFADMFKGLIEERDEHEDDATEEHDFAHDDEEDEEMEAMLNEADWHQVGSPLVTKLMARFELTARQFPLTEYDGVSRRRNDVFESIYSQGGLGRDEGRRLKNEIKELRKVLISSRKAKRASKAVGDEAVQSSSTRVVVGQTADPLASVSATQFEPMPEQIQLTKTSDVEPAKEEPLSSSSVRVPEGPVPEATVIKDSPVSSNQHGVSLDPTSVSHASTGPLKTSTVDDLASSTLGRDVPPYLVLETSTEEAPVDEADSDAPTSDQPGASTAVPEPVHEEPFTSSFWPLSEVSHEPEPEVVEEPPVESEDEEEIEADTDDPSEAASVTEAPEVSAETGENVKPVEQDEGYASEREEEEPKAEARLEQPLASNAVEEDEAEVSAEETAPAEGLETKPRGSEPPPTIHVTEAPIERLVDAEKVVPAVSSEPSLHEESIKSEDTRAGGEPESEEIIAAAREEPTSLPEGDKEEPVLSTSTSSPSRDAPPSQYASSYSQQPSGNQWENELSDAEEDVAQGEVVTAESKEEQQEKANPWDNYEFKDITNEDDFEIRDELDELDRLYAEAKTGAEVRSVMLKYEALLRTKQSNSPRALYNVGLCLDRLAFYDKSNALLDKSIGIMERIVTLGPYVPDELYRRVLRTLYDKMKFRGHIFKGIPVLLRGVERFPDEMEWRHYLIVAYLTLGRNDDAKLILKETMKRWPDDGFSKVHYGFLVKLVDKDHKAGAKYMQEGIDTKQPGTQDGRFFYHLGDAYMRLGEMDKMKATYEAGEKQKLFLSAQQRSLHNVDRLTGRPWWTVEQTTYGNDLKKLASEWRTIRKEGLTVLGLKKNGFKDESESLLDTGDWKEFMLWARGKKQEENCKRAPLTCKLLEDFKSATSCKQGQIKFSMMKPGTHVWAHTGPTNARIRGHLGLAGVEGAKIRVGDQIGEWKEGDFIVFDDSFEHEVWHEGNKTRLILIVDMWHPELTEQEKLSLSPI